MHYRITYKIFNVIEIINNVESPVNLFICLNRAALGAEVEIQSGLFGSVADPALRSGSAGNPQH